MDLRVPLEFAQELRTDTDHPSGTAIYYHVCRGTDRGLRLQQDAAFESRFNNYIFNITYTRAIV